MKRTLPILFCALISPSVWAVNVSSNLNNTAQVVSACSITTISNLNFGLFNPLAETNKTANGRVGVSCTKGNYATRVGYGVNSRLYKYTYEYGSVYTYRCNPRAMVNANGKTLPYILYKDSNMGSPISTSEGRSIGGADSTGQACTMNSELQNLTFTTNAAQYIDLYAKLAPYPGLQAGNYTDTLNIEVTF